MKESIHDTAKVGSSCNWEQKLALHWKEKNTNLGESIYLRYPLRFKRPRNKLILTMRNLWLDWYAAKFQLWRKHVKFNLFDPLIQTQDKLLIGFFPNSVECTVAAYFTKPFSLCLQYLQFWLLTSNLFATVTIWLFLNALYWTVTLFLPLIFLVSWRNKTNLLKLKEKLKQDFHLHHYKQKEGSD